MMKKRTALTLLTATMMVSAAAGTYAQWDKLTDSKKDTLTFRKPIDVTMEQYVLTEDNSFDIVPFAEGQVTVTVDEAGTTEAKQMKLVPKIISGVGTGTDVESVSLDDFEIEVKKTTDTELTSSVTKSGTGEAAVFTDGSVDASNTYTVKVTPLTEQTTKDKFKQEQNNVVIQFEATLEKAPAAVKN